VYPSPLDHRQTAVAATMASVSMADISIKGDAYLQYADNGIDESGSKTKNTKRVNLNVIGTYSMHPSQLYYRNRPL
jgi:hypothetical protein